MIRIQLTLDEAKLLSQLLACCLDDLRDEIRHTDQRDFRNMLKGQEESIRKLLQRIEAAEPKVSA